MGKYLDLVRREVSPEAPAPALLLDPRLDLREDIVLWERLLLSAREIDGNDPYGLYGALHGVRCLGGRLDSQGGGLRLRKELETGDYQDVRSKWLQPHAVRLMELLRSIPTEVGA